MTLSRRPYGDQGVSTELPLRFVAILRGVHVGDFQRSHGASTAFIAISRRFHVFCWRPQCARTALPRRCWRPQGAATAIVRRFHGALTRTPRVGVCFVHAQNKRRPSEFCRVLCDITATPRRSHGNLCDATAMLLRSPRRSSIFRTPWGRRESATIVGQGLVNN